MESAETATEEHLMKRNTVDFDVREVEQRLRSLKRDLEEYIDSDLEGVMMACLSVMQDLKCGDIPPSTPLSHESNGLLELSQAAEDISRDDRICVAEKECRIGCDRNSREVKRKRPVRGVKGQKQRVRSPQADHGHTSMEHQTESAEAQPMRKMHVDDAPGKPNGKYKRTVSLKGVISAFDSWKETQSNTTATLIPSLPPMPEDTCPPSQPMEMTQTPLPSTQPMDTDCLMMDDDHHDRSQVMTSTSDDRPAVEVYVMPSGYIVQSARMVLQQKQAAQPPTDGLRLMPLYQSVDYALDGTGGPYIPVRSPIDPPSPIIWVHVDVTLTVSLMSPRTERFDDSHVLDGIDSGSFLSRMEMQETPLHPLPSETVRPRDAMMNDVMGDVLGVNGGDKGIRNGCCSPEGLKTSKDVLMSSEIESLLQRFDERMEKL